MNEDAVRFEHVTVVANGVTILEDVSASVPMGSCTMVVGPNGAGKTTLLQALLGQIRHSGHIHIARSEEGRTLRIGYVPQRLSFDRGMPLTVLELLASPWQRRPLWFGVGQEHFERAQQALERVHASGLARRRIGALSGGELQRVLVAFALLNEPELLVLDEPTAGMDVHGEQVFCELIEELRRTHGFTQIMVSHDIATVTHHASHVLCLNRQLIAEGPPREVLTRDNLRKAFGVHAGLAKLEALPPESPEAACSAKKNDA